MTRINKMVCHGFKSFARHTELIFNSNYNTILGPNGSGKSNVLDSLCFVLGKTSAKSMRAERASNLIYNGGKARKPAKQGEVSIYFDNSKNTFPTDEGEIKVTRVVRQNGQSIYKINDKTRTRQEIVDLLAIAKINPDAYNIILQGDIVKFVEMSPNERRELVEEIAGISVYEEKKNKAVRELERVQERIKESEIILQERETYLKELKKDRNQALRYKELNDKMHQTQATLYHLQMERIKEDRNEVQQKHDAVTNKLEGLNKKIAEHRGKVAEKKAEMERISKEVEERGEVDQVKLTKAIETLKIEITKQSGRIDTCTAEVQKIEQRKKGLANEVIAIEEKIQQVQAEKAAWDERQSTAEKEKTEFEEKITAFRRKHNLGDISKIDEQIEVIDKKAEVIQQEVVSLREQQHNWLREKDKLEHLLRTADERIEKVASVNKEHKAQLEKLKEKRKQFKDATLELNKRLDEDSHLVAKLTAARREYQQAAEALAKLEAKVMQMQELSAYDSAIQKVLGLKKSGVYGTISDLGEVSSKFALALEVAAAGRIKSIVVDSDKTAAECIKFLKQNRAGTATFLPLNKIKSREEAKPINKSGVHGSAIDLVKFDKKFHNAFSYVLGNTLIVDSIEVARKIGIGSVKMVTLEGDVAERSGAMQGGFRKRKQASGFREHEVTEEIERKQKVLDELQRGIDSFESRRAHNEDIIQNIRKEKAELEGDIIKDEKSLHLDDMDIDLDKKRKVELQQQLDGIEKKLDGMQDGVMEKTREIAGLKTERQKLRDQTVQLRDPSKLAELATFEEQVKKASESLHEARARTEALERQVNEILRPEIEKTKGVVKGLDNERIGFESEAKQLRGLLVVKEKELAENEEHAKKFYARFKSLFGNRNKLNEEVNGMEIKVNALLDESRQVEIRQNTLHLKVEEFTHELAGLGELFKPFEGIPLLENVSEQKLKSDITRFENMKGDIGSVNMRALEIYDDVEREYSGLLEKKDKLQQEKNDVEQLVTEIEGRKKELFMKTFDMVQNNFKSIFSELSTKGEANLVLENPEDPLSEGLRVSVRLSGNKFMDIRSLSGGEKTLTALAFIFAIQEHDPASFYILDEVDAALDKHNSAKLAKLVGKYAERAQYIIISHNDAVIQEADTLYGVSMNEHGMSNVVSLKV